MTIDQIIAEAEQLAFNDLPKNVNPNHHAVTYRRSAIRHALDLYTQRIVQWLRDDAALTTIEARQILGDLRKLTPADTDDWAKLILIKHGIADALEQGEAS